MLVTYSFFDSLKRDEVTFKNVKLIDPGFLSLWHTLFWCDFQQQASSWNT